MAKEKVLQNIKELELALSENIKSPGPEDIDNELLEYCWNKKIIENNGSEYSSKDIWKNIVGPRKKLRY